MPYGVKEFYPTPPPKRNQTKSGGSKNKKNKKSKNK